MGLNQIWLLLLPIFGVGAILTGIHIRKIKRVNLGGSMFKWFPRSKKGDILTGKDAERFGAYDILAGIGLLFLWILIIHAIFYPI